MFNTNADGKGLNGVSLGVMFDPIADFLNFFVICKINKKYLIFNDRL